MKPFVFITFFTALLISSCERSAPVTVNKFADTVFIRIKDLQDRRLADSLVSYFASTNKEYRKDAALAFASLQDSTQVYALGKLLLGDSAWEVRQAAAFALGQTPGIESQTPLRTALLNEKNDEVFAEVLESYGKVATPQYIDDLSSNPSPDALAWSYYRAAQKGKSNSFMNEKASAFLRPEIAESARLGAAHYFARGATDFESLQQVILSAALRDTSAYVRMAAASALGKVKTDSSRFAAQKILQNDKDYRVRINAVRALQTFPFQQTSSFMFEALGDDNINVSVAASETIKAAATVPFGQELAQLAREASNWRVRANLYEAALKVSTDQKLAQEIMDTYRQSDDPYQKASLLIALQPSIASYTFVQEQLFNASQPVIMSAATSSLVAMNYNPSFSPDLRKEFASLYIKAIETGDPAVIGIITGALTDNDLHYREVIKDYSFLHLARQKLSLPKENEAIQPLENAIAYFEGHPLDEAVVNTFNHPIDWPLVKGISRDLHADITSTKGTIRIRLFVEEAPGSVANFVALVKQHYFDNKFFHRVVPNFVVQTGCNRGDGWGSEDYSIRSEFTNRRYTTGSVGMASAGKDTEGTQWFITHSPTPHLDGRYTIFAEVESGMEVVHLLEVGDKILNIELQ